MTDLDLDALEATARAVNTPGPWEARCDGYKEDAEHIAAFDPPTVLALIARLREAEANCHRACAAIGWDAAVAAMRYEDGTPVEIISMTNPYRP